MEKSQPIVIVAENVSSVPSGIVELFDAKKVVGGGDYTRTGKTEILTEKYHNESSVEVKQTTEYGGNPYIEFDMGDDGESFVVGKEVVIKVNGQPKRGIVQEFDDGVGGTIKGFGNPYLFNSSLYSDNGLDYFAFYESGAVIGDYISGHINDGASTFTFKLNESSVTANVDDNGDWIYEIPQGTTITSLKQAFVQKQNLTSLDLSHIDTSNCTDMSQMIEQCNYITSVNLENFDTSACTNMTNMFYWNNRLTSLDLSGFNTHNVTSMSQMFYWCSDLNSITFGENFDTANVTNMSYMFANLTLLSLDISNFDTRNVTTMRGMFQQSKMNISVGNGFDTKNVTDMAYMFDNYYGDEYQPFLANLDTSSVTTMECMFRNITNNFFNLMHRIENWNTANVTNMKMMFFNCTFSALILNWNTLGVTDFENMFSQNATFAVYRDETKFNPDIEQAFPNINWQEL